MSNAKPVAKFRIGLVTASVWKNNDKFHTVTLVRSYKDGDEWKETNGLSQDDCLNAAKVLERAEAFIEEQL